MPKLKDFNLKFLEHGEYQPNRIHLLKLLVNHQVNIEEMADLKDLSNTNLIEGIGIGLTQVIGAVSSVGIALIKGVAKGLHVVTNETTSIVADSFHGLESIFEFTGGGLSGLILYILNFLVIGYLVVQRYFQGQGQQNDRRKKNIKHPDIYEMPMERVNTKPPIFTPVLKN